LNSSIWTEAELEARVRGVYPVREFEFTRSSEDESEISEDEMSSEMFEDEMSSEGESHEILTIQGNGSGQTKLLDSNIVKEDLLAKGHIDPHQVIADARYIVSYTEVFIVSEWLRLLRA